MKQDKMIMKNELHSSLHGFVGALENRKPHRWDGGYHGAPIWQEQRPATLVYPHSVGFVIRISFN